MPAPGRPRRPGRSRGRCIAPTAKPVVAGQGLGLGWLQRGRGDAHGRGITEDTADPDKLVELFMASS